MPFWLACTNIILSFLTLLPLIYLLSFHIYIQKLGITTYQLIRDKEQKKESKIVHNLQRSAAIEITYRPKSVISMLIDCRKHVVSGKVLDSARLETVSVEK